MKNEFERLFYPKRKNPRLKDYDYTNYNYYFVTICTDSKRCIFGRNGQLNQYGKIADFGFSQIVQHFADVYAEKWIVMPNHVHAILVLQEYATALPIIIGQYKSYVTRKIHEIDPTLKV